jgi:DNA ligase-1
VGVGKCEGLMVKTLDVDATYEPSKRSHNWLKCKKDYLEGVGDTLDLVVFGAWHGTGKRTGNYGSYLVGCYNEEEDTYQSCCKVGTGFKDEDLAELDKELREYVTVKKPMDYETTYECEIWFEPKAVWEIKCADFTMSPTHSAAIGMLHETKGIALRFPRYIRKRTDKQPMMATTAGQMVDMYSNQSVLQ